MTLVVKLPLVFFYSALLLLAACSKNPDLISLKGNAFGTFYDIKLVTNSVSVSKIKKTLNDSIGEMNKCCSTYDEESLVSHVRDNKSINLFDLRLITIFDEINKISKAANEITQGFILFDSYDHFNAVAKGYAVDLISSEFKKLNIENFFINIGGEIKAQGNKNDMSWKIGIEYPDEEKQEIFKIINLNNLSVATSGNYKNPGHILGKNKNTVMHNILSISVLDKGSTAKADALATGLYALESLKEMKKSIERNNIPALVIFIDDEEIKSFQSKYWEELLEY